MRKSIYGQLVLSFIVIFTSSNFIASTISYYSTEIKNLENLNVQLTENIKTVKSEYLAGNISIESIEKLFDENYITIDFLESIDEFNLGAEKIASLEDDAILTLGTEDHENSSITVPVAISKVKENYVIAIPKFENLGFSAMNLIMSINMRSVLIGSILFLFVGQIMVTPIKQLSNATKKIADGDFDIELKRNKEDEIGKLVDNFNRMAKELRTKEVLRDNFISDISHEFKTPLTSIEGYSRLLIDCSEDERQEYIDIITEETQRLSQLTTNILTLNKIDNQSTFIFTDNFSLDEQIRKVILLLEDQWMEKNINLEIFLEPISYKGNSGLLYQVWLNLIENAIKFVAEDGKIIIQLYEESGKINFIIEDNGVGIIEQDQKYIFEKFYQTDKSRKSDGNGLGLSIVKRIVEIHSGQISLESKVNVGTKITVKL